jgi:hypothetical protein
MFDEVFHNNSLDLTLLEHTRTLLKKLIESWLSRHVALSV